MHDPALWASWYVWLLAVPVLVIGTLIRDWFHRRHPVRLRTLRGRVAEAMTRSTAVEPLRLGLLWLESDLPPDVGILSRAAAIAGSRLDLELAERLFQALLVVRGGDEPGFAAVRFANDAQIMQEVGHLVVEGIVRSLPGPIIVRWRFGKEETEHRRMAGI